MDWVDDEEGIPGHAAKSGWASILQRKLRELGAPFEAEGEATRIKLFEGVVAEVREYDGLYALAIAVPLPAGAGREADPSYYAEAYRAVVEFLSKLPGGTLEYEVDSSIPDFPILRVVARYENPYDLAEAVAAAASAYFGAAKQGE